MLVSSVQWREAATCVHISPPSYPLAPHLPRLSEAELSFLLPTTWQLPTTCLFHTWYCIYVHPHLPVCPTLSSPPVLCPHVPSLRLCLYSCLQIGLPVTIFLDSIFKYSRKSLNPLHKQKRPRGCFDPALLEA